MRAAGSGCGCLGSCGWGCGVGELRFAELFAGSAAVSLRLLARGMRPPISYMGAKTGYASAILATLGLRPGQGADEVLLVDAGPWGETWRALLDQGARRRACEVLRAWEGEDPVELWRRLAARPPAADPGERAAQYLWVQGRSASNVPVWWDGEKWAQDGRTRVKDAVQRGRWYGSAVRQACPSGGGAGVLRGLLHPATVAQRLEAIGATPWPRTRVLSSHPEPPADASGWVVYLDPPYVDCTSYAADCPRADVVALARAWSEAGAVVAVSEAEPLEELAGWHVLDLTGVRRGATKAEWLTMNREPAWRPHRQIGLLEAS